MKTLSIFPAIIFFIAVSAVSAATPPLASIVGRYVGLYAGGEASFELYADGTYSSSFVGADMSVVAKKFAHAFYMQDGRVFSGTATWDIKDGKIRFWNLPSPFDFQRQGFPTMHTETFANWDAKNSRIVFPKEENHSIQKIQKRKRQIQISEVNNRRKSEEVE